MSSFDIRRKKLKFAFTRQVLTSSTQRQNTSSHVVDRTRTATKCAEVKNARKKRVYDC